MAIPLRIVTAHRPPLVYVEGGNGTGTQPIFTGFLIDLLPTLLQQAQIQAAYEIYDFQGGGGALLSNGSWSGIMGQLTTGRADLALFPLTLTAQRAQYIQHTAPYMDDGYGILVKTEQMDPGYSFLLPFERTTWLTFLAAMLFVMLLVMLLDNVTRRARLKAWERTHGAFKGQMQRKRDRAMSHAIETVMMAVGSGSAPTSRSIGVKFIFVAWAIFCVIMLSAYTANLTAHLTVNQIGVSVTSLRDLAGASAPFGVPAESSVAAYFRNSSDQAALNLRAKMIEYKTTADGAQAVRDGKLAAFINDYVTVQFFTQVPPCDLALGSETVGSGQLVMGLQPNSTLTNQLDRALLQLSEAGYMAELRRKWFVEASQCTQEDRDASGDGRLSLSQAWSVFLVLAAGAGVAVICGVLEVMYYRKFFVGVHELKQDVSVMGTRAALRKRISRQSSINKSARFRDATARDVEGGAAGDSNHSDHSKTGSWSTVGLGSLQKQQTPGPLDDPSLHSMHSSKLHGSCQALGRADSAASTDIPSRLLTEQLLQKAQAQLQQQQQQLHQQQQQLHQQQRSGRRDEFVELQEGGRSVCDTVSGPGNSTHSGDSADDLEYYSTTT